MTTNTGGTSLYNGCWLTLNIALPNARYSAPNDPVTDEGGWWKIRYNMSGASSSFSTDLTTWQVEHPRQPRPPRPAVTPQADGTTAAVRGTTVASLISSGAERSERFGHDDRIVAHLEDEVGARVHERVAAAVDRQQGGAMLRAQPCRDRVDRQADVRVGDRDPIELGAIATRHDVGDDPGQAGVQRGPRQQVRRDLRRHEEFVDIGPPEVGLVARIVDLGHGPDAGRRMLDGHDREDRAHVRIVRGIVREDERRRRLADPGPLEIRLARGVAAHEVHPVPGRVLVESARTTTRDL